MPSLLALDGRFEEHHRFLLAMQLRRLEAIEADIAALDLRIGERLEPYSAPHALLMQIPGVDWVVAAVLIAEIGVDMSVFLSVYHLASWAGVCPGNHESAGRQRSGRARKGNIHLRTILVGAAISASRTDPASGKETCEPKSVSPSLVGQYHSSDLPAGRCAPGLQTLDKRNQPLAACVQHMPRMPINSRQLDRQNPLLLTQFQRANDSGVVVDSSLRGSRKLRHLPSP
jgi:hypothetical protein